MAPRKRTAVVSNLSQGIVDATPNPLKVVGSTGLRRAGGFIAADFLPQLTGLGGRRPRYSATPENYCT